RFPKQRGRLWCTPRKTLPLDRILPGSHPRPVNSLRARAYMVSGQAEGGEVDLAPFRL
ncbi:hypothetical protein M9458_010343, partial [Cirrhinus mrigala]